MHQWSRLHLEVGPQKSGKRAVGCGLGLWARARRANAAFICSVNININIVIFSVLDYFSNFHLVRIFVFLFKIGEAFLGRMSVIFYKEIGFTKTDIALYSKGLGWITTVIFTLLGGLFAIRSGVIKAMFVSGILMASTNLLFSLLAWSGKSEPR